MRTFTTGLLMALLIAGCGDTTPDETTADAQSTATDISTPKTDTAAQPGEVHDPGCTPNKTCSDYAGMCGTEHSDGCVGVLDCSNSCIPPLACLPDETCGVPAACVPDCGDAICGPDGCGGSCGTCETGGKCSEGACICVIDCSGKSCGEDGCGGQCGACDEGMACMDGQCGTCEPSCTDKTCGDDGCGGDCGTCDEGFGCIDGQCETCEASCTDKVCGSDGCGGSCGECVDGVSCIEGLCVKDCVPECTDKVCGNDGCGGACGECGDEEACVAGKCVGGCLPTCIGKACGDDGCGGDCGMCGSGTICVDFLCEALPPMMGAVIINEVLADPANKKAGDANCDGTRDGSEDEFVEIVNHSEGMMDLTGATLADEVEVRHTFADGTVLMPGDVIVVFGGGEPKFDGTGEGSWCGALPDSVTVVTASTGELGINNDGDKMTLTAMSGMKLSTATLAKELTGKDQSVVLWPELTGKWTKHGDVEGSVGAHSPGTRVDGSAF